MKIIFDDYENTRTELPMAPVNTGTGAVKARRSMLTPSWTSTRAETPLFHAWRA